MSPSDIFYKYHYEGLCGSVVVNSNGGVIGIHVAGERRGNRGVALRLPGEVLKDISNVLNSTNGFLLDVDLSSKDIENFSGIKLKENLQVFAPKKSDFIPSPMYGVFDVTRKPANLVADGPHTVKTCAKKSFKPVKQVDQEELDFGKKVVSLMIEDFTDLPMREVISGNDLLSGINKKSSNGFNCPKEKTDCIDYANSDLTENFKLEYNDFLSQVRTKTLCLKDVVWCEVPKDELRNVDKILPRTFRVSRIHMQILTKTIFGRMVEQIIRERDSNEIMIGVNPFKEWNNIYNKVNPYPKFAGDVKAWDGSMLPQVQYAIYEILREKYRGNDVYLDFILGSMNSTPVAVNDDTFLTTHSMPSGSFLTAIMNSIVNRFYTAMWYFREVKAVKCPNAFEFSKDVLDMVYGDDKLNAIKNPKYRKILNAVTMRNFFQSIGMDFTTADKKEIVNPFQNWKDITFLKRAFCYHPELKEIVGPLDISTIFSTLSWVNGKKDVDVILEDKINAFQREIYLHPTKYIDCMKILIKRAELEQIPLKILTVSYLKGLYHTGNYEQREELYGIKFQ
jgi:hypothetical protein